jgi:hypothetical protein
MFNKEKWLATPEWKRYYLIFLCPCKYENKTKIGTVRQPNLDTDGMDMVHHVMECSICGKYSLDSGLSTKGRY